VAAVGSFLDARSHGGRWLLRLEDLDRARLVPGSAERMLRTLEALGLTWDGAVEWQSAQLPRYRAALERLAAAGLTYPCSCTRRERTNQGGYPGTCRAGPTREGPTATRFRVPEVTVEFTDRAQGRCRFHLAERGDVIVRRRDGAFAYQLAVVLDDARQGVTDVVRGADLLDSTPWQVALQQALQLPTPRYLHLPLVVEADGKKLAKSKHSVPVDPRAGGALLHQALTLLHQQPPPGLHTEPPPVVLEWACRHWDPGRLAGVSQVRVPG
jgi:glutamyl-Q tRNA(Asp) synthetase